MGTEDLKKLNGRYIHYPSVPDSAVYKTQNEGTFNTKSPLPPGGCQDVPCTCRRVAGCVEVRAPAPLIAVAVLVADYEARDLYLLSAEPPPQIAP